GFTGLDVVAHDAELVDDGGVDAAFYVEHVGPPLVVNPGGGSGFGQRHAQVEVVDKDLDNLADDGRPAGGAEREEGAVIFEDDGGAHAGERALAGCDGVARGADEAEGVGHAGLDGEVVHLVVHDDA